MRLRLVRLAPLVAFALIDPQVVSEGWARERAHKTYEEDLSQRDTRPSSEGRDSSKAEASNRGMSAEQGPRAIDELTTLARSHFGDLSPAEENLLKAAQHGRLAVSGVSADPKHPTNDPAHADKWPARREIRAALILWMCADRLVRDRIDPKGLAVLGAKIVGKLDLSQTSPPFGIRLLRCRLEDADLASTHIPELDLRGTWVRSLMADNIDVQGSVWLNEGFKGGRVRFYGAQIAHDLDCTNGEFHNPAEIALGAERIHVKGNVFLRGSLIPMIVSTEI